MDFIFLHKGNSFPSSSQLGSIDPTTQDICNLPEASGPGVPNSQHPLAVLDYVSHTFPPSISRNRTHTIFPFATFFIILLSHSFLPSHHPHSNLSQIRGMFYPNIKEDINDMGFGHCERTKWTQWEKGSMKKY